MNPRYLLLAGALLCCAPARAAGPGPCRPAAPATGPLASETPPCSAPAPMEPSLPQPVPPVTLPARPQAAPGEVIVRWRVPPSSELDATALALRPRADSPLRAGRFVDPRTEVLHVEPGTVARAITALEARDDVEYAEPNYARRAALTPSDELYPLQWYLGALQVEAAWDLTVGAETTVVAVVDTGIRNQHPELVGRLLPGYDFIADPAASGDGDGRDADPTEPVPPGFDPNDPDKTPGTGFHGTHITGLIAALADNSRGIAGINWRCRILPLRVLGVNGGVGFDADISAAIRWAVGLEVPGVPPNAHPAKVVNLSFASPGYNKTLSAAIGDAMSAGAVVVASAGNGDNETGMDARDFYPAAVSGVLAVGATDLNNQIAPYSNYGQVVFIMAPGGSMGQLLPVPFKGETRKAGIVSTIFNAADSSYGYTMTQGTSQAAALVSGVASLMLGVNPTLNQSGVAKILEATADKGSTCAPGCGHGLLNAYAAVERARSTAGQTPGGGTVYGVSCALAATSAPRPPLALLLTLLLAASARPACRGARAAARRPAARRCRRRAARGPRPASRPR